MIYQDKFLYGVSQQTSMSDAYRDTVKLRLFTLVKSVYARNYRLYQYAMKLQLKI